MSHDHFKSGEVTVNDVPTNPRLFRFCEKKIDQWLQSHPASQLKASSVDEVPPIAFKVEFTEDDDAKQIGCVTEIQVGGSVWRGYDLATDEQEAFMHSLKRLHPH